MALTTRVPYKRPRAPEGFTPFAVPKPPPGYYDPALDSQEGAANRGLLDLQQDAGTQDLRDTVDYGLGRDSIFRSQSRGLEDIGSRRQELDTSFSRGQQDLATGSERGQQDYQRNIEALTRRYAQLGTSQRQQQSRAGVMRGGAMLQAAAKRTANEAIDRQPLDTSFQRFQADQAQAGQRLTEDHTFRGGLLDRAGTRLGEDTDLSLGDLALKMAPPDENNPFGGRSFQDRTSTLTRAERENQQFGLDVQGQRGYQAAGAGWTPPKMPGNEFIDPATGQHRQVRVVGNQTIAVDPSGRVLWRRPRGR